MSLSPSTWNFIRWTVSSNFSKALTVIPGYSEKKLSPTILTTYFCLFSFSNLVQVIVGIRTKTRAGLGALTYYNLKRECKLGSSTYCLLTYRFTTWEPEIINPLYLEQFEFWTIITSYKKQVLQPLWRQRNTCWMDFSFHYW